MADESRLSRRSFLEVGGAMIAGGAAAIAGDARAQTDRASNRRAGSYRLTRLFHSTHMVPDLDQSAAFFARVFGRTSIPMSDFIAGNSAPQASGYAGSYGSYTPIAEVLHECIDPRLLVVNGVQTYPSVEQGHLSGLAWFADGVEDLWTEFRRLGLRGENQMRQESTTADVPRTHPSGAPIIFSRADQVGMRYECVEYSPRFDPRGEAPPPDLSPTDPLGIQRCSHHTILTDQPQRARHFLVDVLGGTVIAERRNAALPSDSIYVALADGVVEIAKPLEAESPSMLDWRAHAPLDTYHALTWRVSDIDQVSDHLRNVGVRVRTQTASLIITDPSDTLGVPWGFTTADVMT